MACARAIPVIVDPKSRDVAPVYAGATVLHPERAPKPPAIVGVERLDDDDDAEDGGQSPERAQRPGRRGRGDARRARRHRLRSPANRSSYRCCTRQLRHRSCLMFPGRGDNPGCGLCRLALGAGASIKTAARIGRNAAAGVAVSKAWIRQLCRPRELLAALEGARAGHDPKIVDSERAGGDSPGLAGAWARSGSRIGCFDLIHPGHIELLRRSRAACDRLIVALNRLTPPSVA